MPQIYPVVLINRNGSYLNFHHFGCVDCNYSFVPEFKNAHVFMNNDELRQAKSILTQLQYSEVLLAIPIRTKNNRTPISIIFPECCTYVIFPGVEK